MNLFPPMIRIGGVLAALALGGCYSWPYGYDSCYPANRSASILDEDSAASVVPTNTAGKQIAARPAGRHCVLLPPGYAGPVTINVYVIHVSPADDDSPATATRIRAGVRTAPAMPVDDQTARPR
ncbi:hypothetical protein [Paraburkholderia hospita]|jgi:hypothetical protein|uniref:hypothetical protein n=1 Tax=Paraburkholderia hospita TaxID=169430 RepID=UPI0008A75692|nr:hypothetical protein [Paraburkholderia hospita]SEI21420.1 hypothetical protein SAMN05192544_10408 [Paraburkholderia hospita]